MALETMASTGMAITTKRVNLVLKGSIIIFSITD
jgi:hypothetical protein